MLKTFLDRISIQPATSSAPRALTGEKKNVASVILGGGEGSRLYPLTLTRSKPAINFGGKYRLIDVPISNSIHANCYRTFILTQFLSSSLHHHIFQTYMQGGGGAGLIEILTAEQRPSKKTWYQGTADAVRQNLDYLLEHPVDYFLILSGDQLYNIDFSQMLSYAQSVDADAVIASLPITAAEAARMGVLKIDSHNKIVNFHEKPKDKALLEELKSPLEVLERAGMKTGSQSTHLGSMGIYLFKRKALVDILRADSGDDFGKHLIPSLVEKGNLSAFLYQGFWEDIGTIETFYHANMALMDATPKFSFYNELRPIFSCRYDLPPARFANSQIKETIICEGSIIEADEITHSILGPRSVIHSGAIIRDSYLMGNDYYQSGPFDYYPLPSSPHIGENSILSRTILDKNVKIGKGVQLINKKKLLRYDGENIFIRDGIIIVPRGAVIPDGFTL